MHDAVCFLKIHIVFIWKLLERKTNRKCISPRRCSFLSLLCQWNSDGALFMNWNKVPRITLTLKCKTASNIASNIFYSVRIHSKSIEWQSLDTDVRKQSSLSGSIICFNNIVFWLSSFFTLFWIFFSIFIHFYPFSIKLKDLICHRNQFCLMILTCKCKRSRSKFQLINFYTNLTFKTRFCRFSVWTNYQNVTNVVILTEISSRNKFLSYKVWMIFRIGFGFDKFNLESVWHFQFIPTVTRKFQS